MKEPDHGDIQRMMREIAPGVHAFDVEEHNDSPATFTHVVGDESAFHAADMMRTASHSGGGWSVSSSATATTERKMQKLEVNIMLDVDIAAIASGTDARRTFEADLIQEFASAMGIPPSRVFISSISSGEVVIKLKQGFDEVEQQAVVTDYSDSVLLGRTIIENRNEEIREMGKGKVATLTKIKDFNKQRRGVDSKLRALDIFRCMDTNSTGHASASGVLDGLLEIGVDGITIQEASAFVNVATRGKSNGGMRFHQFQSMLHAI